MTTTQPAPAAQGHDQARSIGTVVAAVVSVGTLLVSLVLLGLGLGCRLTDAEMRDADGFLTGMAVKVHSDGHAVISEGVDIRSQTTIVDLPRRIVGEIKVEAYVPGGGSVFIGVADTAAVNEYLAGVAHSTVVDVADGRRASYVESDGGRLPLPPAEAALWDESASGPGRQTLVIEPREGDWTLVVMRADGAAPVDADVRVGATVPWLGSLAVTLLVIGLVVGTAGALGLRAAVRRERL